MIQTFLFATAVVITALFSSLAQAKEVIPIVYSWSPADPAANFDRAMIDEANRLQDRYQFVFEAKPGGGGVVAANAVTANPNAVLATASMFFVRPSLFPNDSYDLGQFQAMMPKCIVTALITSKRYSSWSEVPRDKHLTIGVSGVGTLTYLIAQQIRINYPNMILVPYKSTTESLVGVVNDSVDFSVNFIGDVEQWVKARRVHLLGATGDTPFQGVPTLVSQGFSSSLRHMSPYHQYVVSTRMDAVKFQEINDILSRAALKPGVKAAYAVDQCIPQSMPRAQLTTWYQQQRNQWRDLTKDVKLD